MEWNNAVYRRRIHLLMTAGALLWIFFLGRFGYLQIIRHEELSEAAELQHQVRVEGLDSRGMILDRNLNPLTGTVKNYYYFIPKDRMNTAAAALLEMVSAAEISAEGNSGSKYMVWRTELYDEDVSQWLKERYDAYILCLPSRYGSRQTACHLVGYMNEDGQTGAAGLEKAFEEHLKSNGRSASIRADGVGRFLASSAPVFIREGDFTSSSLVTTLDINLQNTCENAMYDRGFHGTVLVSCADSGEILAWVSSPYFDPNAVEQYSDEEGSGLINKCIQSSYPTGDLSEIAAEAAALEYGTGNPDPEQIREMAEQLGFGKTVMGVFEDETAGSLPGTAQDVLLATPVQVHQMMSAAASGGMMIPLSVVFSAGERPAKRVFSADTARQLVSVIGPVMDSETGKAYSWPCTVYGKTGTGGGEQNGRTVNHCWFSGFYGVGEKNVVVTVLVEEGVSGEESCLPVAADIVKYLAAGSRTER